MTISESRLIDVGNREDISRLIVAFYGRAFEDEAIGFIFTEVMQMHLDAHLPIMCDFWETVLFKAGTYRRDALVVHQRINEQVPMTRAHFQRWEDLWHETVDELFAGERANLAKLHASRMSGSIQRRLANGQSNEFIQIASRR